MNFRRRRREISFVVDDRNSEEGEGRGEGKGLRTKKNTKKEDYGSYKHPTGMRSFCFLSPYLDQTLIIESQWYNDDLVIIEGVSFGLLANMSFLS